MDKACPVPAPRLLKAKSTVWECNRCGAWGFRFPTFMGCDDYWDCEKCGCTSVKIREGRPYAPKSKDWGWIVGEFEENWTGIPYWEWDSVVTEPPMANIDWERIEAWYRSRNIYRMFIHTTVSNHRD